MSKASKDFLPLSVAILTVSDRRGEAEDTSGHYLKEAVIEAGHHVVAQHIVKDNIYSIRAVVSAWIADEKIQAILINGGTGFTAGRQHSGSAETAV